MPIPPIPFLKTKKKTKQYQTVHQQVILDALKQNHIHPSAQQLFQLVKEKIPNISFATVYRQLTNLALAGKIKEISPSPRQSARYDAVLEPHQHFICRSCAQIFNISSPEAIDFADKIKDSLGSKFKHQTDEVRIELLGVCDKCLKQ